MNHPEVNEDCHDRFSGFEYRDGGGYRRQAHSRLFCEIFICTPERRGPHPAGIEGASRFREIGVDRIDEAVLEARSIDRILGNATSYGMEEVRSLKTEESGDFVWKELLRVMELTATHRAGSFLVRELGFWPLLDDLGNKRRSKRRG